MFVLNKSMNLWRGTQWFFRWGSSEESATVNLGKIKVPHLLSSTTASVILLVVLAMVVLYTLSTSDVTQGSCEGYRRSLNLRADPSENASETLTQLSASRRDAQIGSSIIIQVCLSITFAVYGYT